MSQRPAPYEELPAPRGPERRAHPRVEVDLPITLQLASGYVVARLRDLSRSGLCFFLEQRIAEMTVLKLQLDLPASGGKPRRVVGSGVVVRCQRVSPRVAHYEVAVFLNELSDADRARLDAFVAEQA